MTPRSFPPTRALREHPDLDQLRRQAKELLAAFVAGDSAAVGEVNALYHDAQPDTFALHDAQLVIARSYGYASWPKLKAHVEGVTVRRLIEAVHAGDLDRVRTMLDARPELVRMEVGESDEHLALHHAVFARNPAMVRLLMQRGANARKGIYPHREATAALVLAFDRGYDEIVAIIQEEEGRRTTAARPAGSEKPGTTSHGAGLSALQTAVASGDIEFVKGRHAEVSQAPGGPSAGFEPSAGLLTIAAKNDRAEMLALLLGLGLDPDERVRLEDVEEIVYSGGAPLHHCAGTGKLAMAKILLEHGADPNVQVYASGSSIFRAYMARDREMIGLLERHGGVLDAVTVGMLGETAIARRMLDDEAAGRLPKGAVLGMAGGTTVAEDLLWGAAGAGAVDIVEMALASLDWPRDDERWNIMLREAMYIGLERSGKEREAMLTCFRLILERADANVWGGRNRGWSSGRVLLHDLAGSRHEMPPEDRVAIARMLLDTGARLDVRDGLLLSTPLGWACRWGRAELVELYLERGADPVEADAEPWATPRSWASKWSHRHVLALLASSA